MFKIYDGRTEFYQWDLDRKLIVADKAIKQVHFCNRTDECSLICQVYEEDGQRLANVPNILLQDNWRINVYGYDKNYTKHSAVFEVIKRSKPADYVYTETEVLNYSKLDERITALEQGGSADLSNYYTKTETDTAITDAIGKIDIPEADLTGYATEQYVDEAVANKECSIPPLKVNLTKDANNEWIASHSASEIIAYAEKGGRVYLTALDLMYMGEYYQNSGKPGGGKYGVPFRYWGINQTGLGENLSYISEEKRLFQTSNSLSVVDMVGATADAAGAAGYVPAPAAGDNNKYLRGDGTWGEIDIPEVDVDLTNYYTKGETDAAIQAAAPDLTDYAKKSDIPDTTGFITMAAVEEKGYQTEEQVNTLINNALGVIENGTY